MDTNIPTLAEVDAAEAVLSEGDGTRQDGYWRATAAAVLEAAKDAALVDFIAEVDDLIEPDRLAGIAELAAGIESEQESDRLISGLHRDGFVRSKG